MIQKSTTAAVKFAMIFFWVLVLGSLLYFPVVMKLFRSKNSITVFTWTDLISNEQVKVFEQRTGIQVKLRYFENNEELFIKMLAGRGEGFDIIIPSDYVMRRLIDNQLLKKIDRSRLDFFNQLNPQLLGAYYDPNNQFSIPYHWAIYGIGVHKHFIAPGESIGWRMIFEKPDNSAVAMLNSARESIALATLHLFGRVQELNYDEQKLVQDLLRSQRSFVESYVDGDMRAEYLLRSGQVAAAVMASSFTMAMLKKNQQLDFVVPHEGSFLVIDNIVMSAYTDKDDAIYSFINFLFEPAVIDYHFNHCTFVPTTTHLTQLLDLYDAPAVLKKIYAEPISHLYFFKSVLPEAQLNELWMKIKL
jgi:spermidine/putrescine transport system substrate-binding protein